MKNTMENEMMPQNGSEKDVEKKYGPQPLMSREMVESLVGNQDKRINDAAKQYLESLTELERLNGELHKFGHR